MKKILIKARKPKYSNPPSWWKLGKFLWRILGNSDEPEPPKWFKPNKSIWYRRFYWLFVRNILHNFTWYVIGFKDKDKFVYGKEPNKVFVSESWNWLIIHPLTKIPLYFPFVSYQKKISKDRLFQFYIGMRPDGAWGFKFRITKF